MGCRARLPQGVPHRPIHFSIIGSDYIVFCPTYSNIGLHKFRACKDASCLTADLCLGQFCTSNNIANNRNTVLRKSIFIIMERYLFLLCFQNDTADDGNSCRSSCLVPEQGSQLAGQDEGKAMPLRACAGDVFMSSAVLNARKEQFMPSTVHMFLSPCMDRVFQRLSSGKTKHDWSVYYLLVPFLSIHVQYLSHYIDATFIERKDLIINVSYFSFGEDFRTQALIVFLFLQLFQCST